jgi:hypothetical protein
MVAGGLQATGSALSTVIGEQKRWSGTAASLKNSIEQARRTVLWLAVLGAILETLAAQFAHVSQIEQLKAAHAAHSGLAMTLGYLGAAALAVAAVVRQWKLGHERAQAWILSRAGSESLKREIYRYRTQTGPYSPASTSTNPDLELLNQREEILKKLEPYQKYAVDIQPNTTPLSLLDAAGYLDERVSGPKGNVKFFYDRSNQYIRALNLLNGAQFTLAILGALLGVAVTLTGTQTYGAWVAVITTITGALAAHTLAQRYEQLTISYRATGQRLEGAVARWQSAGSTKLGDLVEACENILLEENQSWIAGADQR